MSSRKGTDQDILIRSKSKNKPKDAIVFPVVEGGSHDEGIDVENNPAFDIDRNPNDLIAKANKADMNDS